MDTLKLMNYFRCTLSQEEEAEVIDYLANDPDGSHYKAYKDARTIFEGVTLHAEDKPVVKKVPAFRRIISYVAATAVVALLVTLGSQWSHYRTLKELSNITRTIKVPAEQSLLVTLTDGTELWLGAGTEVEIPQVFPSDRRSIRIVNGEAYLNVAKDAERPFVVDTHAGEISVLGTKFNVIADKENNYFVTTLFEGSVKVSGKSSSSIEYTLKPTETLKFNNGEWSIRKTHQDQPLWTEGIIDLTNISFKELLYIFERTYDIDIHIECTELPELNYTMGKIRIKDGIRHAMDILKLSSDFNYEYDEDNHLLYIR